MYLICFVVFSKPIRMLTIHLNLWVLNGVHLTSDLLLPFEHVWYFWPIPTPKNRNDTRVDRFLISSLKSDKEKNVFECKFIHLNQNSKKRSHYEISITIINRIHTFSLISSQSILMLLLHFDRFIHECSFFPRRHRLCNTMRKTPRHTF